MRYLAGAGNYSATDDSIGLRLVEHIAGQGLEKGFCAVDLSKGPLGLLPYLNPDCEGILIVDAARMGLRAGEVRFFKPDEVRSRKELAGISTHEADLLSVLELAAASGSHIPPITLMGIEPQSTEQGFGLSKTLEERFPDYVAAAVDRIPR